MRNNSILAGKNDLDTAVDLKPMTNELSGIASFFSKFDSLSKFQFKERPKKIMRNVFIFDFLRKRAKKHKTLYKFVLSVETHTKISTQ